MHVHRSAHARNFTVLPNEILQDRRLTYTSRGLLIDLLSRPDGWREDGRHMADTSPQGRQAIYNALKELALAGYYRVVKVKRDDGTIISENHVFDTPQPLFLPGSALPGPGSPEPDGTVVLTKDPDQEPTLPTGASETAGRPRVVNGRLREAAALLLRVVGPEKRLRIGQAEAEELAPLVVQWQERGAGAADLAAALL